MSNAKKPFWKRPPKSNAKGQATAPVRSRDEIQAEYDRACNTCGDLQYKILAMGQTIEQLHKHMAQLNQEMFKVAHQEAEAQLAKQETAIAEPPETEAVAEAKA